MLVYGHRGARGEAPENTLASFHRAVEAGVNGVELDLRLSRDGQLVVIHDDTVNRTTGARGLVVHFDADELARLDARRNGPPCAFSQPIPTIERVLEEFPSIGHFQLEAKPINSEVRPLMAERLAQLFHEFALYQRATVTSFDPGLLDAVRQRDPAIPLGLVSDRTRPEPLGIAERLGAKLLILHWKKCTRERIDAAHAAGLSVSAWTVNDDSEAVRLLYDGVDSIVTDFPTRIIALIQGLGAGRP
jgi:glycerophosphoryl diester phosphodiesterase